MNRIEYKGITPSGKWKRGYLCGNQVAGLKTIHWENIDKKFSVVENTVGQFIGVEDKFNNPIYVGDIIDIGQTVNGQSRFVIMGCIGEYDVRYAYDTSRKYEYDARQLLDVDRQDETEIEVIGNIHVNPEMINTQALAL